MRQSIFICLCLVLMAMSAQAQYSPLVDTTTVDAEDLRAIHSPRKATIRSAILPGWGQAYNKKYWKIPVVYAGIGTCVYFIDWNHQNVKKYKEAVIALQDDDPLTVNTTGEPDELMDDFLDLHRRWRDLSYMSLGAVYILNIIDANVDAHLFHFDVNEDLSASWSPGLTRTDGVYGGITLRLTFK